MRIIRNLLFFVVLMPVTVHAQASLDSVLAAVRSANKTLIASRIRMEAEKSEARTRLYLPNPEVQFDYLWGDPGSSGNRTDFSISQDFSFPSVYFQKANQSELRRDGAELNYMLSEREQLQKAESVWVEIVGVNKQLSILRHRISLAKEIADFAKDQLGLGDIDVIKYHHAQMEYVNLRMEYTAREVERSALQSELQLLCGGKDISVRDTLFPVKAGRSAGDMIASYTGSPLVTAMENEVRIRNVSKNIAVSEWLPSFSAGYYSEVVTGLTYRGIQAGISLPLWQNINTVKSADFRIKAAEAELMEVKHRETAQLRALLDKRDKIAGQVQEIRSVMLPVHDLRLIRMALQSGEINISEYFFETAVFYTTWSRLFQAETELALTETEIRYYAGIR